MKFTTRYFLSIALIGIFTAAIIPSVFAEDAAAIPKERTAIAPASFTSVDTNGDGKISPDEFEASKGTEQAFQAADADKNGSLSKEEFFQINK